MSDLPRFPFAPGPDVRPPAEYRRILASRTLPRVRLADGTEALVATSHADVRAVLSDPRFGRSAFTGRNLFARSRRSLALVTADPPVHGRRRAAVAHAFGARRMERSRAGLRTLAGHLLAEMAAGPEPADLVGSFTVPLPMLVICRLLGVPEEDRLQLKPWVDAMMSTTRYAADQVAEAHERMHRYFEALVAAKRGAVARGRPRMDLLTELITSTAADGQLDADEVAVMGAGLLMAGYETTSNSLASCAYLLLRDRRLADRLRGDPGRIPDAVEEMLRFTSLMATGGMPHVALADVRLGETVIRAGEVVIPIVDAANHDPAVFLEPDRLAEDGPARPHLAFGFGRHRCVGAELARVELQVGITELLRRFPSLALAIPEEELRWREGMFVRGPWALPVRWGLDAA